MLLYMNCDIELHIGLQEMDYNFCPFCNQNFEDSDKKQRDCSSELYVSTGKSR